jgi:hypothetical protein
MKGDCISLKYRVNGNGSIGVQPRGLFDNPRELEELAGIPEKLKDCGAKLVYLDLTEGVSIDSSVTSPIMRLYKELNALGIGFEIRINGSNQHSFFKNIELESIMQVSGNHTSDDCVAAACCEQGVPN